MEEKYMKWREEVLDADGLSAAERLAAVVGKSFYLAGGTGLALRLGHRVSLDLDLFSSENPLEAAQRNQLLASIQPSGSLMIVEDRTGTCHLRLKKTAVSLFHYPYPLLRPVDIWRGLSVASFEDIAAMKVSAIVGRGSRKDFVDLYAIIHCIGMDAVMKAAVAKFKDHEDFPLQAARALVYFKDAEKEPMPRMLQRMDWRSIKFFFEKEIPGFLKKRLRPI